MYTRFELYYEGEPQDIGLMMGLNSVGMPEDEVEELMERFDKELPMIPRMRLFENNNAHFPGCYFTEKGLSNFQAEIDMLLNAIHERDNGWSVNRVVLSNVLENDIYYQDEYQAVIKTKYHTSDEIAV